MRTAGLHEVQKLRNRVVHADLDVQVSENDIAAVPNAVRLLLDHAPADAAE